MVTMMTVVFVRFQLQYISIFTKNLGKRQGSSGVIDINHVDEGGGDANHNVSDNNDNNDNVGNVR